MQGMQFNFVRSIEETRHVIDVHALHQHSSTAGGGPWHAAAAGKDSLLNFLTNAVR
jgi:hypothetical protein